MNDVCDVVGPGHTRVGLHHDETSATIRRDLDGQADAVAAWLREQFRWREHWLAREMFLAAERVGIDLGTWRAHPTVSAVLERCEFRDRWCPSVGVIVFRQRNGRESESVVVAP